jgi:inorganic triphosphatase YgiF
MERRQMTATKQDNKSKDEVEQALIIRGDDPAGTAADIASITKLGGDFLLMEQPDQLITDTYLNTENRDLKGSSLRIREVNGKTLVTIKGKNKNAGLDKPASRTELEVEWPWEDVAPWDIANLFNMNVVQKRTTNRTVRNVYSNKKLVAELAIDEVCYNYSEDYNVRFFEIEVEGRGDNLAVPFVVDQLKKKFPSLLKKWNNSKLSTGSLLKIALGIETDENGLVTDESFDNLSTLFDLI